MASYNHACFLREALQAIVNQTYTAVEIVVVDDCSTDESLEIVEEFRGRHSSITVLRNQENRGVIFSATRGLEHVSGKYVYFASADDKILPAFFEKSMTLLAQYPDAGLCSTLSAVMDEAGKSRGLVKSEIVSPKARFIDPRESLLRLRRRGIWILGNTAIYRRQPFVDAGGLIPELGSYSDGFISLVLARRHGACFIPEPLAVWRRMRGTYSASSGLKARLEIGRVAERLMRSTYKELFPSEYVDEWRREWLFGAASSFLSASRLNYLDGLARLLQTQGVNGRALLAVLRVSTAVENMLARVWLFMRLRRPQLPGYLRRRLMHATYPWRRGWRR